MANPNQTRKVIIDLLENKKYKEVADQFCFDWFVTDKQLVTMVQKNSKAMLSALSVWKSRENDFVTFKQFEPMDIKARPRGFYLYTRTSADSDNDCMVEIVNGKVIFAGI